MAARIALLAAACLALSLSAARAQQPTDEFLPEGAPAEAEDWAMAVIHLDYANAEEMAVLLSQILPTTVRVVPYYQTNTLVISGDAAVIAELVGDEAEVDGEREADAATAATIAQAR